MSSYRLFAELMRCATYNEETVSQEQRSDGEEKPNSEARVPDVNWQGGRRFGYVTDDARHGYWHIGCELWIVVRGAAGRGHTAAASATTSGRCHLTTTIGLARGCRQWQNGLDSRRWNCRHDERD